MGILHVSDSGSSTSPYENWDKAAATIDLVDSVAVAGDTVYIDKTFDSGYTTTTVLDFSNGTRANPVKVISSTFGAGSDGDATAYGTGALISNTTGRVTINGHIRVWGVDVTTTGTADITANGGANETQEWYESVFSNADNFSIGGDRTLSLFLYSTFNRGATVGEGFSSGGAAATIEFIDCTVVKGTGLDNLVRTVDQDGCEFIFTGCDVSDFGTIVSFAISGGRVRLRGCEVSSSITLASSGISSSGYVYIEACSNGTITVPELGVTELENIYGISKTSLSKYRTSGADDGEQANAYSWEMVSSAETLELSSTLRSPPIVIWDSGGSSKTFKIFVASGVTYQDDELWIELIGPAVATSTARRYVERSNDTTGSSVPMNPRDTPANLTTDSASTWTGTGVGTKQEMSITYTPGISGPVTIRVFLAKASSTVYIDPKIDVS